MTFMTDAELDDVYKRSKIDEFIAGSEVRQLVGEIRQHRALQRGDRVDVTLARRLGEHIQKEARLRVEIKQWLAAYPLSVFPEPDLEKAAELLKAGGQTLDAVSANMGRHVLTRVLEMIAAVGNEP
jgi:hypothetical protein